MKPIVESPEEAVKTFLACKGACAYLILGNWIVQRRPFPMDGNAIDDEIGLLVSAEPFYLSGNNVV